MIKNVTLFDNFDSKLLNITSHQKFKFTILCGITQSYSLLEWILHSVSILADLEKKWNLATLLRYLNLFPRVKKNLVI